MSSDIRSSDDGLGFLGLVGLGLLAVIIMENEKPIESAIAAGVSAVKSKLEFVQQFGPIDEMISEAEGFPVGVLTAWAAMESNYAMSALAVKAKNLFGIKAGPTWKGEGRPFVDMPTHEYQGTDQAVAITSSFRVYNSWEESARDALKVLVGDFHGAPYLDALRNGDIAGFLRGIAASGYSTAANYGQRIENFMKEISTIA